MTPGCQLEQIGAGLLIGLVQESRKMLILPVSNPMAPIRALDLSTKIFSLVNDYSLTWE